MERIVVYEGDTAEGLAKEFCEKNGLTEDMEEKLKMLLEQQIAGVLPKIVEDDVNESEEDSSIQYGNRRGEEQNDQPKDVEDQSPTAVEAKLSDVKDESPTENQHEDEEPAQKSGSDEMESPYMNPDTNEELADGDQEGFDDPEDEQDDTSINEDLYNSIMQSIGKVWPEFNQADGVVGEQEFPDIMIRIARDQNLLDGGGQDEQQLQQNKMFFTKENLVNIFQQIKSQEQDNPDEEEQY